MQSALKKTKKLLYLKWIDRTSAKTSWLNALKLSRFVNINLGRQIHKGRDNQSYEIERGIGLGSIRETQAFSQG